MTAPTIQDFRLSFIWFEPQLCLFDDQADPARIPFSFLRRDSTYQEKFTQVKQDAESVTHLSLPWRTESTQLFWYYYMEGQVSENVTPRQAWKAFVPFRGRVPWTIKKPSWLSEKDRFLVEAFYYPHGIALTMTVACVDNFTSLDQVVDMAFQIRMNGRYEVEAPESAQGTFPLNTLASKALGLLHDQVWGEEAPHGSPTSPPFSIFTIVRGSMDDASVKQPPDDGIHKALEGVTNWSRTYKEDTPTLLNKANLFTIRQASPGSQPGRIPPPSHVLYATNKGRAVWFPATFIQTGNLSSLACYHRNLLFTTMQVESLCRLASEIAKQIPNQFHFGQTDYLDRALKALERLYGRTDKTYQSWSARAQLDLNVDMLQTVNQVRIFRNIDPLHF